ncbi:MAG: HYR domain-containing protein [Saprospiraceae bacterium]|nr:HYR domain-containing protein [Saprospiraceae bacterium]
MMASTCSANVALTPIISDNCTNSTVKYYYTLGTATSIPVGGPTSAALAVTGSGSNRFFTGTDGVLGTTIVNYIVTDASGNTNACSMTVSVKDDDVPFIMCPVPVTISANTDCKGELTAPFAPVMVTDNCDATPSVTWSTSGATME